jgi:hypothetical protein
MKPERSKLARLVIACYVKFGRHAPEPALRRVDARELAGMLEDSLATEMPLSETGWGWASPREFSPRDCIMDRATPTKLPSGKWLH